MRWIVAVIALIAFAMAMNIGSPAEAAKAPKAKQCLATDAAGKKISFRCAADEKCCWQPIIQKAACIPATGICL
jgi:hypothetical protein